METFTLTIELGNDAMQDGRDVAEVLTEIARKVGYVIEATSGRIFDANGNTVGGWEFR